MRSAEVTDEAIVLSRKNSGNAGLVLRLFCRDKGILNAYKKISTKRIKQMPDLFDCADITFEQPTKDALCFVKSYEALRRHSKIGNNYANLAAASRLAQVLQDNLPHMAAFPEIYELLVKALAAWEQYPKPQTILLKSLYALARMEGLPIKEAWARRLNPDERALLKQKINYPLSEDILEDNVIEHLLQSLELWLQQHANFVFR